MGVHDQVRAVVAGGEPAQRLGSLGDAPRLHGRLLRLWRDDAAAEGLHRHPAVVEGPAHGGAQGRLGLGRHARALDAAAHHVVRDLGDVDTPQDGGDVVLHLPVVLAQARLRARLAAVAGGVAENSPIIHIKRDTRVRGLGHAELADELGDVDIGPGLGAVDGARRAPYVPVCAEARLHADDPLAWRDLSLGAEFRP